MPILDHDAERRSLLKQAKTIAVVGMSDKSDRDSYQIGRFLLNAGYRVIPVNPAIRTTLGLHVVASLEDIDVPVDLVDVFRRPEFLSDIVDAAIRIKAGALWLQLGTTDTAAADRASAAGLAVIREACIMVEHRRLIR